MTTVLQKNTFIHADAIWLTPLIHNNDVFNSMINCNHNSLCIIGDKDPVYKQKRFEQLSEKPNFSALLMPNVNHSLDIATDTFASIETIKLIIKSIEQFKNIKA